MLIQRREVCTLSAHDCSADETHEARKRSAALMPKTSSRSLHLILALLAIVLVPYPGKSQDAEKIPPASPVGTGALTPGHAQQALEVLQDDIKRAQLIDTLRAIATASPGVPPQQTPSLKISNSLGAELLEVASASIGEMSHEIATTAQSVTNFPLLWYWLVQTANDPFARDTLLGITWKLVLVVGCALAAEWIVLRAVRRPLALLEQHVSIRADARHQGNRQGAQAGLPTDSRGGSGGATARGSRVATPFRQLQPRPVLSATAAIGVGTASSRSSAGPRLRGRRQRAAGDPPRKRGHAARGYPGDSQRLRALPGHYVRDTHTGVAHR
jgi:hypothetical protein